MVCLFRDIQVVIPTTYKATYDKILEENATYTLCNFQVVSNDLVFKASEHKFLLKWTGGTTAEDINVHDVPQSDTKFKPFAEIISGKWKPDILVSEFIVVYNKLLLFILFYLFVSKNLALFFFSRCHWSCSGNGLLSTEPRYWEKTPGQLYYERP